MTLKKIEKKKHSHASWMVAFRIGITVAFFYWAYIIFNSTADLNEKLIVASAKYSAIHNVQVEYKTEIQEWKNVLLRSNSQDSLDKNWRFFEKQYQKVSAEAQDIILKNDVRAIKVQMQNFVDAHAINYELYKKSVEVLIESGFNPHQADSIIAGIDRPLENTLEAADAAMQDEKKIINENLTYKARDQIEQALFALCFLFLVAVWMPR